MQHNINFLIQIKKILEEVESNSGWRLLKYIKVANKYRFADAEGLNQLNHKDMLMAGETATSAGFVKIKDRKLSLEGYSTTLQLGRDSDDAENISSLLGLELDSN